MIHRVALVLVAFVLVAAPASADTYPIIGKVAETYTAAGGAAHFGAPLDVERKATVGSTNGYGQPFEHGFVFWSKAGHQTWVAPKGPTLAKVSNERDALAASGFRPGVLYRSAALCSASTADKLLLDSLLRGGTVIDLRTSGTCKEPSLVGAHEVRTSITSKADYAAYVTSPTNRKAFAAAFHVLATAPGPILVHCTAGKDRTGWLVTSLLMALGAPESVAKAEYFRTSGASSSRWNAGVAAVAKAGGWPAYIHSMLTPADIAALQARYGR